MKKVIPKFLQSVLWSYPIDTLDIEKDKDYIITQVLNYGDWDGVKWVKKIYGNDSIKAILKHPPRGEWFPRTLNFWEQMFDIKIDPKLRKRAIFDVNPNYDYTVEDFK